MTRHRKKLVLQTFLIVLILIAAAGFILRIGYDKNHSLANLLICVGFSGLVGQLTNKLAIRMILDYVHIPLGRKRLRVPGSGLLQRNLPQLIDFISEGAAQILSEEVIKREFREQQVVNRLLEVIRVQLEAEDAPDRMMIPVLRLVEKALEQEAFYLLLRDRIVKGYASEQPLMQLANVTGIIDYDDLTYRIIGALQRRLYELQSSPEAHREIGRLLPGLWDELQARSVHLEESLFEMAGTLLARFDLAAAVRNRLLEFTPAEIRDKVEEGAADYLGWIELWGGLLGAVVGLLMAMIL